MSESFYTLMCILSYPILSYIRSMYFFTKYRTTQKTFYFLGESLEGKVVGWANTKSVGLEIELGLGLEWVADEGIFERFLTSASDLALLGGVAIETFEVIFEPLVDSPRAATVAAANLSDLSDLSDPLPL